MSITAHDLVIGGVFTIPPGEIIAARSQPGKIEWKIAVGKSGLIWLYNPEISSVWCSGGKGSRGCGGNALKFPLVDGMGEITLVGPRHSNADAFFKDTEIDIRSNFITWGCVGTGLEYDENTGRNKITGVVYFDDEPTKGLFHRFDLLAWEMQEQNPEVKLFSYCETEGGSSCGHVTMPYKIRVERGLQKPIEEIMGW